MTSKRNLKKAIVGFITGTLGCLFVLAVVAGIGFIGFLQFNDDFFPEEKVYRGTEMTKRGYRLASERVQLAPNERITYFMSSKRHYWAKEAQVLTDERFISFYRDGDEKITDSFYYADIVAVEMKPNPSVENGQIMTLTLKDGGQYSTWATSWYHQADIFKKYIESRTPGWEGPLYH